MFIFFCENCKKFDAFKSETGNFKCPDCGGEYLPLGVTVDEWNNYSDEQMLEAIKNSQKPQIRRPQIMDAPQLRHDISETPEEMIKSSKPNSKRIVIIAAICAVVVLIVILSLLIPRLSSSSKVPRSLRNATENYIETIEKLDKKSSEVEWTVFRDLSSDYLTIYNVYNELSALEKADYDDWLKTSYNSSFQDLLKDAIDSGIVNPGIVQVKELPKEKCEKLADLYNQSL